MEGSDGNAAVRVRHAMYENGVIARASQAGDLLSVVFYPALVVSEDDLERGVAAVADALGSAVG